MVMLKKISHAAVHVKERYEVAEKVGRRLVGQLLKAGISITTVQPFEEPPAASVSSIMELKGIDVDVIFAVGGDGTILRTLRPIDWEVPILGVKVGIRGVLLEITPDELPSAIAKLKEGRYLLDRRMRIVCSTKDETFPPALNDVFFTRISQTSLPTVSIRKEHDILLEQRMDGLIVSTPTGTTAHSLSGGGPVLYEEMDLLLLTPICPLLRLPPLVLPPEAMEVSFSDDYTLVLDGQVAHDMKAGEWVRVRRYETDAVFVRFNRRGLRQLYNLGFI